MTPNKLSNTSGNMKNKYENHLTHVILCKT